MWQMLGLVALGYGAICAGVYLGQHRLIYFPDRSVRATPERVGLDYEDVWLGTEGGERVHGWWIAAPGATRTVLFLHGNAGNVSDRLETVAILNRIGANVLIIDYRGYGRSDGSPGEQSTYEDALAAWRHLREDRTVPAERIVVFGRSLGGGVATWLAANHRPGALIVESSFTSVPDMAARTYPFLPVRLLARVRYPSIGRIAGIDVPTLIAHSPHDEVIPYAHGQALYDAAAGQPKAFLEMRGGHGDGFVTSGAAYVDGLRAFLDSAVGVR